eukprot:jgi/Bigna1/60943/fgenesh1_kg.16_\
MKSALIQKPELLREFTIAEKTPLEFAISLAHPLAARVIHKLLCLCVCVCVCVLCQTCLEAMQNQDFLRNEEPISDESIAECALILLEAKCDPNQMDRGYSPLQRACRLELPVTAQLLLDKKADVNIKTKEGWNLIHVLANKQSWSEIVNNEVLAILLGNGVDPFEEDSKGSQYLDLLQNQKEMEKEMVLGNRTQSEKYMTEKVVKDFVRDMETRRMSIQARKQ